MNTGGMDNDGSNNGGSDNSRLTTDFFSSWSMSYGGLTASFREVFAPHCVWDQRPMAKTTGPDAAIRFMDIARTTMGLATIDVEIVSIAAVGDKVLTERIDTLCRADGTVIVAAPVAGVLTFEGGRLVHWREYFDSATFAGLALGSNIKTAATSAAATMLQLATKVANRT
jgi:limonene-1,2-epoxide hydrolase